MGMIEKIGQAAMFEQMAEECCELGKACLKISRIIRKENPTPIVFEDATASLQEEFTDVIQCAAELGLQPDLDQMTSKFKRFIERWENFNK